MTGPLAGAPTAVVEVSDLLVDGLRTRVAIAGSGPVMVLLHGGGPANSGLLTWSPVLGLLAASHTMLCLDLPGFGASAAPAAPIGAAQEAQHVAATLDGLRRTGAVAPDGPLSVVGHSLGGRIACYLALARPREVSALVLLDSGAIAPHGNLLLDGTWSEAARALLTFGTDDVSTADLVRVWRQTVFDPRVLDEPAVAVAFSTWVAGGGLDRYREAQAAVDPMALHNQDRADLAGHLGDLRLPVLLLWGREDASAPYRRAVPLLAVLPDAELRVLPRCGHNSMWDRPSAVAAAILDFVSRGRPGPGSQGRPTV